MDTTIKYINWKLDVHELKNEINKTYLDSRDNIKRIENKANNQIKSNKESIIIFIAGLIAEVTLGIMVGFTMFDLFIMFLFVLQIIIKYQRNKLIVRNTALISLETFVNSSVGSSLVMACELNDLLKIDVPGDLGERLKSYDAIINSDIQNAKYIEDKLTITTDNSEVEISIPVYVRDGDCDAITVNTSGVFIGLHKNVALRDIVTKEVNIPISINRNGEKIHD